MSDNPEQIADWDGPVGQTWAAMQEELDAVTSRFGEAALAAAAAQPGERAVDVGCGCGDTSIALARAVGRDGAVLGADVSHPMLAVAERRAKEAGLANLSFRRVDASNEVLPADQDLLFSRFGVMFFDDPVGAFANMRSWLKPSGRVAFCCWRHPRENPWAMTPVMAVREALNLNPPPADLNAPGPFAFADIERLEGIMRSAGFTDFAAQPFDAPVPLGPSPEIAADRLTLFGPAYRAVHEAGEHTRPIAIAAIAKALAPYAAADGSVSLKGSVWIVTARAG